MSLKEALTSQDSGKKLFYDYLKKEDSVGAFLSRSDSYPGFPIAVKDNIMVKGLPCTAGSKILEDYVAPYDATVVRKLKEHGFGILGKTNLDEFAMGSSTENSAFRRTVNPFNKERVPGGSSGGSAAAVAADLCLAALGSDTGGSIRQPASFCGVVGFKPTYGAVSRYGLIAMASSLDQIGTLTKTVEDSKILFEIIKGQDPMDATSLAILNNLESKGDLRKTVRLGVVKEFFAKGLAPEVEKIIAEKIKLIKAQGFKIKTVSLPNVKYALAAYYLIMLAEASSNLARFDAIRYGASRDKFGREVKRRIMLGTYILSSGYYDAYYLQAQKVRTLMCKDFRKAFTKVDLLLAPTAPTTAFKFGEKIDDPLTMYLSDIYTVPVNLAGLPAISLPGGEIQGLPVGLQVIGPHFSENLIFRAAGRFESLFKNAPSNY